MFTSFGRTQLISGKYENKINKRKHLNIFELNRAQLTLTQCPGPNSPAIGLSDQRPAKLGSVWQHLATVKDLLLDLLLHRLITSVFTILYNFTCVFHNVSHTLIVLMQSLGLPAESNFATVWPYFLEASNAAPCKIALTSFAHTLFPCYPPVVPELHRQSHCPQTRQWCLCSTQWVHANPASESGSACHRKGCQTTTRET